MGRISTPSTTATTSMTTSCSQATSKGLRTWGSSSRAYPTQHSRTPAVRWVGEATQNFARASARVSLRIAQAGHGRGATALTPSVSQGTNTTASVGSLTTMARCIATTLGTPTSDAFRGMLVAAARMETTLSGQASLCGSAPACRKLCSLLVQFSFLNGACRIREFRMWLHCEVPHEHDRAYVPAITPSSLASSPGFPSDFAAHVPASNSGRGLLEQPRGRTTKSNCWTYLPKVFVHADLLVGSANFRWQMPHECFAERQK